MSDILHFIFVKNFVVIGFAIITPLVFLLRKNIRKQARWYYAGAAVVMVAFIWMYLHWRFTNSFPTKEWYWPIINQFRRGSVGFVLFTIVMFQGVIKPWNRVTKELFAIRGELSILACFASMVHLTTYTVGYLTSTKKSDWAYEVLFWSSITLFTIGIPLFVTSFKKIRFAMTSRNWHKLHKVSYIFYFILYLNVILVFVRRLLTSPERLTKDLGYALETYLSLTIYCSLFVVYTILRIKTSITRSERAKTRELKRQANEEHQTLEPVEAV